MPDVRITVDGRPALTTAQAATRHGRDQADMRRLLHRYRDQLPPVAHLDGRTPLYDEEHLAAQLPPHNPRGPAMRTWTLLADCPAGRLQAMVQEYFPGRIAPSVTDGAWASVDCRGPAGEVPQWMRQLAADYAGVVEVAIQ